MGDVGDHFRELKDYYKDRRKRARNEVSISEARFFEKRGIEFEIGVNTLIFRTPNGTVVYYPPSGRMQHKTKWFDYSPSQVMKYVLKMRMQNV